MRDNVYFNIDLSDVTLRVPPGSKPLYEITDVWKDFGIIVETTATADTLLCDLRVGADTLSPTFNYAITDYTVNVAYRVTSITITGTACHSEATVGGNGEYSLSQGNNTITVTVTSEDGTTTTTYTVTIVRAAPDDADLKSLTVDAGTLSPSFNADTTNYTINVTNEITNITVTGTANHDGATVSGNGVKSLSAGDNVVNIRVTAEDGTTTKTYTVTIVRAGSDDADLKSLTVDAGTLSPSFNADMTNYTVNVANEVTNITVTGTANHDGATVGGNGVKSLSTGDNVVNIMVIAENGTTTKTYTVTIVRASSDDADLKSLTVSTSALDPLFNADTTDYTVNVANTVTSIIVTGTANHGGATVSGNGIRSLSTGRNVVNIMVTAEDGTTMKVYTVTIVRAASNDADLKSLTVSTSALSPSFNPDMTSYTVNVSHNVTSITVAGTANHSGATVNGNGNKLLSTGDNIVNVTVTAEDGTTKKTYIVTIVRAASDDADLKNLKVNAGALSPSFNPNTTSYTVNVSNNVTSVTVTGTANHNGAAVDGNGNKPLVIGDNVVTVVVTAENGTTTKSYTVTVVRANATINLTAFAVEDGATVALKRTVRLHYSFSGGVPTHFRLAESETALNGAAWQAYDPATLAYTFVSDIHEYKTVYTQLKNGIGETSVRSAGIIYKPVHPKLALASFALNAGNRSTASRSVTLSHTVINGVPTRYGVSENPAEIGTLWQPYHELPRFELSVGTGPKTVYFVVANDTDTSEFVSAQILLDETEKAQDISVQLFPNPTDGYLNVRTETVESPVHVKVYDLAGTAYLSQSFDVPAFDVDLSRCPSGVLLVRISIGDKYTVKRIIKKN